MTMRGTILVKFLALFAPAFLIATAVGLSGFAHYRVRAAQEVIGARVGGQVARVATLTSKLDLPVARDAADQLLSLLLFDRGIICADVIDDHRSIGMIAAPQNIGCKGFEPSSWLSVPIDDTPYELKVGLGSSEIDEIRAEARNLGVMTALASLIAAGLTAATAFRRVVLSPIGGLLAGIRESAATGRYSRVTPGASDEIGELINSFNGMQGRLEKQAAGVAEARERIERLYNTTPTMLFTLNELGVLSSVSDFWLELAGCPRSDAVGAPLKTFAADEESALRIDEAVRTIRLVGAVREVPLRIRQRRGGVADVSFSAALQGRDERGRETYVCVMTDVSALKATEAKLNVLATTDVLTGLPNRAALSTRLSDLDDANPPTGELTAAMLIDLDNFRWVNDTFGHGVGDQLLIAAAARIRLAVGDQNFVARLGGDEFAVVCRNLRTPAQAEEIARAVIAAFVEPVRLKNAVGYVGASVGIAFFELGGLPAGELLRRADSAMYRAKREGKGRFAVFAETQADADMSAADIARAIEAGLENNWFQLHYQPIVELQGLRPVGVEALLRLLPPDGSVWRIDRIIRVAEESGQIEELGGWILQEAAAGFAEIAARCDDPEFHLSVNVSTRQLGYGFLEDLRRAMIDYPIMKGRLVLEITDSGKIGNFEITGDVLRRARDLGARIAIDDFGVGNASFNYLSRLPVDVIKVDKSYIDAFTPSADGDRDIFDRGKRRALVRASCGLAKELGMSVVAEGVEDAAVCDELRNLSIDQAQGFAFSRPMPKSAAMEWVGLFFESTRQGPQKVIVLDQAVRASFARRRAPGI